MNLDNRLVILYEPNQREEGEEEISVAAEGVVTASEEDAVSVVGKEAVPAKQYPILTQSVFSHAAHESLPAGLRCPFVITKA